MVSVRKVLLVTVLAAVSALLVLHFSLRKFTAVALTPGCASLSQTGEVNPADTAAFWQGYPLSPPLALNDTLDPASIRVLGVSSGDKWIEIDLSDQRLTAHDGDKIFLESLISSGLWNKTPAGEYAIWYKTRSTKMEGGIKGSKSYYYLSNVPYAMFFKGDYGIHGTYWHSNFGNRMSHGCVNMKPEEAGIVFNWASVGTRVQVHQ